MASGAVRTIEIGLPVHRAIESARLTFEESESDILERLLGGIGGPTSKATQMFAAPSAQVRHESALAIGQRTTGDWSVHVDGALILARSLREAYLNALAKLSDRDEDVLRRLAEDGSCRRGIVAKSPEALYPQSQHLAQARRNNWYKLGEWYVDLNLSRDQVAKRIRRACALAGWRYGTELIIKEGLQAL